MNSKVGIEGNVGVALSADPNANVYITVNQTNAIERRVSPEANRSVHVLLKACEKHNLKSSLEAVSQLIFDSDHFKSLSVDQLKTLQLIAQEFNDKLNEMQSHFEEKYDNHDEVDFNNFYKETAMRASTPERFALRLLFKEHVTPGAVKLVRDELLLDYKDDNQLYIKDQVWRAWVGWPIAAFAMVLFGFSIFAGKIVNLTYQGTPTQKAIATLVLIVTTCGPGIFCAYQAASFLRPYYIAKRIKPYVEKVNIKLKQKVR